MTKWKLFALTVLIGVLMVAAVIQWRTNDCQSKGGWLDWRWSVCLTADDRLIR